MKGYNNWKKAKETFNRHPTCKAHNDARLKCDDLMNQRTNMHFYHVEVFLASIDAILFEINHRFGEVSSELLVCMVSRG
jgi:hypothetical protein